MQLGFAITQHCNLRCPHCIRDDVVTVREIEPELVARILDEALELWDEVTVSLTGGEPLIHRRFADLVETFRASRVAWRMVSNGWHLGRIVPLLEQWPAESIRLSLSGATREIHDHDRGQGSFERVLRSVAILTRLRIPTALTIVIDRRTRHQLREAADLAEALGCPALHYILPQPVPGSAERDSDLPPEEWLSVKREIDALAREPHRRTRLRLDYGELLDNPLADCSTFALERLYVDAHGRISLCCQLSEYGLNESDVVADLHEVSLARAWPLYLRQLGALRAASRARLAIGDEYDRFACIRCARCTGKLDWLGRYPRSPWARAAAVPV